MTLFHATLTPERWWTMTIAEQLGNVGSEVSRAIKNKEQGDRKRFDGALARLLELMDLTIADPRWRNHRLKELCRAREVVCDFLVGNNEYRSTAESLMAYFDWFALRARAHA